MSFPDLRALDLFVSAVEAGSVAGAARSHRVSQPSASSRIRALERSIGVTLLERHASGSTPTAEGQVVVGWARQLLREAHAFEDGVQLLRAGRASQLRVAASFTLAEYLLPRWLTKFSRVHPGDAVALTVANSSLVIDYLLHRDVDIGFIESPGAVDGLVLETVAEDELVVVVGRRHPWWKRDVVSVAELIETPLVLRETGSGTRGAFESAISQLGVGELTVAIELGSTAAVLAAAIEGDHPTVVSQIAAEPERILGRLRPIDVDGLRVTRQLRAAWPGDRDLPEPARTLLSVIAEADPEGKLGLEGAC